MYTMLSGPSTIQKRWGFQVSLVGIPLAALASGSARKPNGDGAEAGPALTVAVEAGAGEEGARM